MTLALLVFGVLGYQRLGVDQFPDMDFPMLGVIATLDGATPEGMEEDVVDVLEEHLNSIAGLKEISSQSRSGSAVVRLQFELGMNVDDLAQDAREQIAIAQYYMTTEIETPQVGKHDMNARPILWIPLETDLPQVQASEWVRLHLKPLIETVPGVAGIDLFGRRDRAIRIWLDGDALHARGLAAGDVMAALAREHVERPGGYLESERMEYGVRTDSEFRTLEELRRLVVLHQDGAPVYLEDVAWLEDGSEDVRKLHRYNGAPTVGIGVRRQSGSNAVSIVDEVYRRLDQIAAVMPRTIRMTPRAGFVDFSEGVRESVAETQFTLVFGALLAVLTVFVFLRRVRPTLIVAAAIPISLVTTFGLVFLAGFTLNVMTLLAMSLAVGVVIDDAIVVLENIERHRASGEDAFVAAEKGTREIAFAATASTVSIAAVFLPVFFVEGIVGAFLGDFGLTVAGAVMISLFVALTLTPMLAARMPPPKSRPRGSIYFRLETWFANLEARYRRALDWTLTHRGLTLLCAAVSLGVALGSFFLLKSEFFPPQDIGLFWANMETAPGSSPESTLEYLQRDENWFLAQPEVAGFFAAVGDGSAGEVNPSQALIFGRLKPRAERERSVHELIRAAREELGSIPGRDLRIFNPATMMQGSSSGKQFEFEIRGQATLEELDAMADRLMRELERLGGYVDLDKSLELGLPELRVIPDREKAAALGVDAREIAEVVQAMIGGIDVGVFQDGTSRVDIRMRLDERFRADPEAIRRLYVRTKTGDVVELRNLVDLEMRAAPTAIERSNRQRSVEVSGNLEGRTLGEALGDAQAIADRILPETMSLAVEGQAEDMLESFNQFGLAIGLGLIVIYMVLAAQFESLIHPFTVMMALPFAMTGATSGLYVLGLLGIEGMTINLFSLIGIILLFGLVTKNSILLVDYANQLRETEGLDAVEAMRRAAPVRMRPVLMTGLSMIFGVLPAAVGLGPGAETRMPMAVATACGMISSMVLTLLLVPVIYVLNDGIAAWLRSKTIGPRERARAQVA
jgi:HAE1 family hydrophobic/amphiphilic exporter-1